MSIRDEDQSEKKSMLAEAPFTSSYPNRQGTDWSNQSAGMEGKKISAIRNGIGDVAAVGRERWSGRLDFLLSCVGFAVGLGNVWRFPYLCYKNGGGAFLIPYFICAILGGIPLFFLEAALGQYTSLGGIKAWKICPLFQGIGISSCIIAWWCNIYYIIILAWALYYLVSSFTSELPWVHCGNSWNTEFCVDYESNFTCVNETVFSNDSLVVLEEMVVGTNFTCAERTSPVQEFWEHNVLHLSPGLDEMGSVVWHLAVSLLVAWILCYFCIWKGVKWTGKVVYFTATFPYVMLTVLLIRGVTLPGAADGLLFYVKPDLSRLTDGQVWMDSGTQIFYSYAVGLGACISLGSYNKYHHNVYRDSMILAGANSFTSLYGGIAIFSVLGYMSHEQGVPIDQVASKGPGLAFIAYPRAVALMPLAPLWAILFFVMILMVGLDSQFVAVEGFVTALGDLFPTWMRRRYRRELFVLAVCIVSYLIGLIMVMEGGMYVFQIFDTYAVSGIALLWIAFFEGIAVSWVYGANRFYDNLVDMIGYRPIPWFKFCWMITLPIMSVVIWIFSIVTWGPMTYDKYEYPIYAEAIGFFMALSSMVCIPIVMVYQIFTADGTFLERIKFLIEPSITPQTEDYYTEAHEMEKY